eukprot:CAMPEP_0119004164 /NCGR_PEP_ID=MMETSP1176-20130426/989_1 /TAXON_ID=265551 /ORGANISM="Synedropsis recta cf, Strain CCMP1620" /LENGTH=546 /DNA_ID=CAMNT_0006955843 /DNA_START=152 /DNA_END=1788 /DNA_ORIENTATION=+
MSGEPNRQKNQDSRGNSTSTSAGNESLSVLLQSKKVDWKAVQELLVVEATASAAEDDAIVILLDSLCLQALSKACLDPTVCPQIVKLVLDRCRKNNQCNNNIISTLDMIRLGRKAARCNNTTAYRALVQMQMQTTSLLSWKDLRGNTLLHLVCAENGWNAAIACLLDATLEQQLGGLFQLNVKDQCPFWLALEAGADIAVILDHLKLHHRMYIHMNQHQELLTKIVAEYCSEMTALEQLVVQQTDDNDNGKSNFLDGAGDAPLYYACYYQNPSMIRFLLHHYQQRRGDKRRKLLKRLMTGTTMATRSNIHIHNSEATEKTQAPLTCLILGVGRSDPGNSIECIQACLDILRTVPLLHHTIEEALWPNSSSIHSDSCEQTSLSTKQCLQTVKRIIDHWQVDLLSFDDKKRTVVSLLITKHPVAQHSVVVERSIQAVLEYILSQCPGLAGVRDRRKRLPLHLAVEAGWRWGWNEKENEEEECESSSSNATQQQQQQQVLAQLVQANPSAVEVIDPKFKVYPFALATDLTTIYNLLRYQPGVLVGCRPR